MADKTLEQLHAEWLAARDELRAFERRLGVMLQEMNDKEITARNLRLPPEHVGGLQRLVEQERRLADAFRTAQLNEPSRQALDELELRAREQAVADDDGMSQADAG